MADLATTIDSPHAGGSLLDKKMKKSSAWVSGVVVGVALLGGLGYIGVHVAQDLNNVPVSVCGPVNPVDPSQQPMLAENLPEFALRLPVA